MLPLSITNNRSKSPCVSVAAYVSVFGPPSATIGRPFASEQPTANIPTTPSPTAIRIVAIVPLSVFLARICWNAAIFATVLMRAPASRLLAACLCAVAGCASQPEVRESQWGRVEWDSLYEIQVALAAADGVAALELIAQVRSKEHELVPPERMWLAIYEGIAHDLLSQRAEAAKAFRRAAAIHPHAVAVDGQHAPIKTLKHLEKLKQGSRSAVQFRSHTFQLTAELALHYTVMQPRAMAMPHRMPTVIRMGHPTDSKRRHKDRLLDLWDHMGRPANTVLIETDVLERFAGLSVDAPPITATVPKLFAEFIRSLAAVDSLVDPDRIYLFGFSFDGVWALILGLSQPDLYAGVVALSAITFPTPIAGRPENGANLPLCILRGANDHIYPRRREQEEETGRKLVGSNPGSRFRILPNVSHTGVWSEARQCFDTVLPHTRERWPTRIVKTLFSPDEASAYWVRVERYAAARQVDWKSPYARLAATLTDRTISLETENAAAVRVDLEGSPLRRPDGVDFLLGSERISPGLPWPDGSWCAVVDVSKRQRERCR